MSGALEVRLQTGVSLQPAPTAPTSGAKAVQDEGQGVVRCHWLFHYSRPGQSLDRSLQSTREESSGSLRQLLFSFNPGQNEVQRSPGHDLPKRLQMPVRHWENLLRPFDLWMPGRIRAMPVSQGKET